MVLIKIAVLLGVLTTLATASLEPSNVSVQLMTSAEMDKMLQENQNAQQLSVETSGAELGQGRVSLVYYIGGRASGDRLVSTDRSSYSWTSLQNVKLTIQYPAYGVGAIVTYVQINVDQSSNLGRAYVTAGGIGQRFISIAVEAQNTLWFNYVCSIYGK